jgi:DNA repair exonuclease SbcCD ATPase subunit
MQETKLHEDLITGLKANIKAMRTDKDLFVKAQGIVQQAEQLSGEALKKREEVATMKAANSELIITKNAEVAKGLSGMIGKMKEVLPEGEPIVSVEAEGNVFVGWKNPKGNTVAYSGLSGGEKVAFDNALAYALKANIIVSEFAELDDDHLPMAMKKFAGMDVQVLLSTCHPPKEIGKDWTTVRL